MNKSELVAAVAEKSGLTKKDAEKAVNALLATVEETVRAGDKVALAGFGTFEKRHRNERAGRNPQNGEALVVAAKDVPAARLTFPVQ